MSNDEDNNGFGFLRDQVIENGKDIAAIGQTLKTFMSREDLAVHFAHTDNAERIANENRVIINKHTENIGDLIKQCEANSQFIKSVSESGKWFVRVVLVALLGVATSILPSYIAHSFHPDTVKSIPIITTTPNPTTTHTLEKLTQ